MNTRRKLLLAIGASAFTLPLPSFSQQQAKVARVGFLSSRSRPPTLDTDIFGAFTRGMRALAYVEGRNLVIEWRFAEGKAERHHEVAAELVKMNVDVILAAGPQAIRAAQKATSTIPIVMGTSGDPVGSGFVKSLAQPGGNITGISNLAAEISPKQLAMLLSVVPKLSSVAVLINPTNPDHPNVVKNIEATALKTGVKILPVEAATPQEIENAFAKIGRDGAGAVIVARDGIFNQQARQIAQLAAKHKLPSVAAIREYVEAGGLMIYGSSFTDNFRHAASYVNKILKGAKPADLPVEQPTRYELVINSRTAKALGIRIPQSLLMSANKVV